MRELLRQEIAPLKLEIEKISKTHDDLQTTVSLLSNKYDDLLSQYRPRNWQALSCFITKVTLFQRAWNNGSYTMMAKPIRAVEFHHPMIQFLIKFVILVLELYSGIVQITQFASMSTRSFVIFNSSFGQFANVFYLQAGRKFTEVACNTQKGFRIHTKIIRWKNSFKQKTLQNMICTRYRTNKWQQE